MFHHLAHLEEVLVKTGDRVKKGQLIGLVGSTGSSTAPHLHYEIMRSKPKSWTQYVSGMSKSEVADLYIDPKEYMVGDIPAKNDRNTGWSYLQKTSTGIYHPGEDINSGKDGWADFKAPVVAPCDGEVVHADHDGYNGGWGDHMWIEEKEETEQPLPTVGLIKAQTSPKVYYYTGKNRYWIPDMQTLGILFPNDDIQVLTDAIVMSIPEGEPLPHME